MNSLEAGKIEMNALFFIDGKFSTLPSHRRGESVSRNGLGSRNPCGLARDGLRFSAAYRAATGLLSSRITPEWPVFRDGFAPDSPLQRGVSCEPDFWSRPSSEILEQRPGKLREALAHQFADFRRPAAGAASGGWRWSVV
jgi:hypothetical protein